ncbi:hypothetical protein VNO80_26912 [Phaseolus coccineus]|uniref:Uncharacterized protein n=1 Tax=Phaseolus coccineus TaxID=3886 RepID=A0AAN9QHK6_PHACN
MGGVDPDPVLISKVTGEGLNMRNRMLQAIKVASREKWANDGNERERERDKGAVLSKSEHDVSNSHGINLSHTPPSITFPLLLDSDGLDWIGWMDGMGWLGGVIHVFN